MAGYHLTEIKKGQLGHLSKVQEELDEAVDSVNQGVKIMLLVELSDLVGAVKSFAQKNGHTLYCLMDPSMIDNLKEVSSLTQMQKHLDAAVNAQMKGQKELVGKEINQLLIATGAVAKIQGCTFYDLIKMQEVTERAFTSGSRK